MLAGRVGSWGGGGEVNFLLTTPNPERGGVELCHN
jgi:hypothetical protein